MSGANLRKFILFDKNGRELELTSNDNAPVEIANSDGSAVDVQHPLPTDGDSVYAKDIDVSNSDIGNFSGVITDPFDSLQSVIVDSTSNNPKEILVHFKRSIFNNFIGVGAISGNFSNIEIQILNSGGVFTTVFDNSADGTKETSVGYILPVTTGFNGVKLRFHTADPVSLSNLAITKYQFRVSRLQGVKPDGTVVDIGASDAGNLKVTDAENGLAIAKGEVVGTGFIHKFGNAPDFDATDGPVTVWDGADDGNINQMVYQYSTGADIDSLSSSSGADTQDIEVQGLDVNYELITQTVTLTGQTRAVIPTPLRRVFRLVNRNAVDNAGHIYCFENVALTAGVPNDPTLVRAVVQPGNNQTLMAVYTVPAGKTGYMRDWFAAIAGGNKTSNYIVDLRARPFGEVFQLKHKSAVSESGSSYIQHQYSEPEEFVEKTDIEMVCEATATGVTAASLSAGFDIVLVDD